MNRTEKAELIDTLHATFNEAATVVITHQVGLTVVESSDLRGKMRANGASYKVTKNRIAKMALKDTAYEGLTDQFTGPTAIGTSPDPVSAAKTLVEFAKEEGEEPRKDLTELDRLAFVVRSIDRDTAVVPRGAYILTHGKEIRKNTNYDSTLGQHFVKIPNPNYRTFSPWKKLFCARNAEQCIQF